MVRGEVFRGRYRNGFDKPEAFEPDKITPVKFRLYDVAHTFAPGHKIMIQIHSTWFPLIDRNPQQFINTYTATVDDLKNETISIYHQKDAATRIILPVIKK
jgi:predicted acyl esterase